MTQTKSSLTPTKLVFLTQENPFPATGGGKLRDSILVRLLSELCPTELLCLDPGDTSASPVPVRSVKRETPGLLRRAISPLRSYVVNGYSRRLVEALDQAYVPGATLWISRLVLAQYIRAARRIGYRVLLDEHNVESRLYWQAAMARPHWGYAPWLAAQTAWHEKRFCRQAHALIATSESDASLLKKLAPNARVHVIPNLIDVETYAPARIDASIESAPRSETLLFTGTLDYAPNWLGMSWFASEIWPKVRAELGGAAPRVVVAGARPSSALLRQMREAGIEVIANPPSMLPLLKQARLVMVPLRQGSGTRLKILEALASRKAVISTTLGAEGLGFEHRRELWIADTPDEFLQSILLLWNDAKIREEIANEGLKAVQQRYDWKTAREAIASLWGNDP